MARVRDAFLGQLRQLAVRRRFQVLFALFLGASWLGIDTYRQTVIADVPIEIVDLDGSKASRLVREYLLAMREVKVVSHGLASIEQAQELLVSGELCGVVLIPDGFSADLKRGRRPAVVMAVDMSNITTGKTAYRAVSRALATVSAGAQLTLVRKLGEPKATALARVLPITVAEGLNQNPTASYAAYVVPALAFFFLNILVLFLTWSVLMPADPAAPLAETGGRLLAVFTVGLGLGLLLSYGLLRRVGIAPQSGWPVVLAPLATFLALDILMATALAAVLPGELLAFQVTILLGMLSLMFSGITWPSDMFPAAIRWFADFLPFTPFARSTRIFLQERAGLADLAQVFSLDARQAVIFLFMTVGGTAVRRALPSRRTA